MGSIQNAVFTVGLQTTLACNNLPREENFLIRSDFAPQTIVHNFKLDKAFDNITSSYDEIVANYRTIEKQLEQKGQENSAKILSDGEAFDKVTNAGSK